MERSEAMRIVESGLRDHLSQLGYSAPHTDDAVAVAARLCHLRHRYITPTPRRVVWSSPSQHSDRSSVHKACMRQIADRSEKGHDLNPYLSVRATRTGKQANDALLNDWGINHFHLGRIAPDGSVDRTSDLLFVVVQPETLYFLEVLDHGSFEAESLFLTMEAEFPHLVEPYRLDVIEAQTPDEAGRRLLRQAGFTLMTKGKHGYYFGPGGGVVASGRSSRVIDQALRLVNRLTTDVLAKQMEIRRNLGLGPADTFKLVFRDGGFVPVRT